MTTWVSSNLANTFVLHNFFALVVTMTDVSAKLGKTFGDLETNSKTMTTDAAAITTAAATCGATASQYTAAVTTFKVAELSQLGVWSHDSFDCDASIFSMQLRFDNAM
jgi:hypothetical protein